MHARCASARFLLSAEAVLVDLLSGLLAGGVIAVALLVALRDNGNRPERVERRNNLPPR
jgi:hypothetical protein